MDLVLSVTSWPHGNQESGASFLLAGDCALSVSYRCQWFAFAIIQYTKMKKSNFQLTNQRGHIGTKTAFSLIRA